MFVRFDDGGRAQSRDSFTTDIPRVITKYGDAIGVVIFYAGIYNANLRTCRIN